MKAQRLLPGRRIVPERIRENRAPCYEALQSADQAREQGRYNITDLTQYLDSLSVRMHGPARQIKQELFPKQRLPGIRPAQLRSEGLIVKQEQAAP